MGDLASARANMVTGQIYVSDVQDARVLDALREVARERFLQSCDAAMAYADVETPLEGGRALLMPLTFARLLQLANIGPGDLVLDVGCATGYSSAVLAQLAGSVVALEADQGLAEKAGETLTALGVDNVAVVQGPFADGYASEAPYDVIFLNGSLDIVPQNLLDQLSPGGRLVAIVGTGKVGRATVMTMIEGRGNGNNVVAQRQAFDAAATPIPGFAETPEFVF